MKQRTAGKRGTMYNLDSDEQTKHLLQRAFRPAQIPQDFKDRLREQLVSNSVSMGKAWVSPLWSRPRIMVPIMASVTGGLISYGAWTSWNLSLTMLH
jgi:hypothetical protein